MGDYRVVLKRVGTVLIAIGLVDIAYMAYCVARGRSYSSSFNVFAVIAGIFLWRGHLGATRLVTRFSAFFLGGTAGALLLFPWLVPASLWVAEFKIDPIGMAVSASLAVATIALLVWIYRRLRSHDVIVALANSGRPVKAPRFSFGIGMVLALCIAIIFHLTFGGSTGSKAIELATAKYGTQYRYTPTAINWAGGHVAASLTAYNDHEIKSVQVEWSE